MLPLRELLRIEEPLVDLNAREPSAFHGLTLHLSIPVTVKLLEETIQVVKLLWRLFGSANGTIYHSGSLALFRHSLLAEAFAGDFDGGIGGNGLKQGDVDVFNAVLFCVDEILVAAAEPVDE